ncbi:MAG: hypothetical protein LBJ67_11375 [Planctomycetaceae bacterium]|jgi:hypothetical protein|nr:hypothetical protein [Planctomycetaceae bacterium]
MSASDIKDWVDFGKCSLQEIAEYVNENKRQEWLQRRYAWLYQRLDNKQRNDLPEPLQEFEAEGPLSRYVPVLQVIGNKGCLGVLAVDSVSKYGQPIAQDIQDENRQNVYDAAKIVFDLFRFTNEELGEPDVELELHEGGGTSLSLPAMFAALGRILGITWNDTLISTGCLENGKLKPVETDTLQLKVETAQRFGYKTLVLVEGQTGIPRHCPLTIKYVSTNPNEAIFNLIKLGKVKRDRNLARFLFGYDQKQGRNIKPKLVQTFVKHSSPLVRYVANDILFRNALHHGETEKAKGYRDAAETLEWNEIPNGYLGHYLRFENIAASAVLEIDLGNWDDNYPIHQQLDRRLEHLQNAIGDSANKNFADRNDYLAALILENTKALRKRFQFRLMQNRKLLNEAWDSLTFLYKDWKEIFKYAERLQQKETTLRRQRNYCIEVLTDYFCTNNLLPPNWKCIGESWNHGKKFQREDIFDDIAFLNYGHITAKQWSENQIQQLIERTDERFAEWQGHPNYILYENILRFRIGSEEQRKHCLSQLEKAYPSLTKDNRSILSLLALRTRQILLDNGCNVGEPILPAKGTALRKIADNILQSPKTLINRCPY